MNSKLTVCLTGDIDYFEVETIEGCLKPYFAILQKYQVKMTIPITAKAVKDYPERTEFVLNQGHEVAIHGDIHEPFHGSVEEQMERVEKAKKVFKNVLGFIPAGFRAPYLHHDKNTYLALIKTGFNYDSSQLRWEVPPLPYKLPFVSTLLYDWRMFPFIKSLVRSYINLRRFVKPLPYPQAQPFYLQNQLVELPITGPDDWYLISRDKGPRYSPQQAHRIAEIWLDIFTDLKQKGNRLFVVLAHPGRMSPSYLEAIDHFLKVIRDDNQVDIKVLKDVVESFIAKQPLVSDSITESPENIC